MSTFPEINNPLPTPEDTSRIFRLVRMANPLKPISTDSARRLLAQALELNQQLNFPDGMAAILIEYAACDLYDGNYENSIHLLHKTYEYTQNAIYDIDPVVLRLYNYLAVAYNYIGRDDRSLYYHYKSLQLALQYSRPHNDLAGYIPLAYTNIGITLYRAKQYQQSLYYLYNAEKMSLVMRRYEYLGEIYINIAKHYRIKKDWPRHDYYVRQAFRWNDTLSVYDTVQYNRQYTSILSSLGESYLLRNNPSKALECFQKARAITHSINPYENKLIIDKGLGTAYLRLKNYPNAQAHLLEALNTATLLKVKSPITANLYQILADMYHEAGDIQQAYKFQKEYSLLNDSLLLAERQQDINRLEIQYRASEKDKSIALQDLLLAEKSKQLKDKNLLIVGTTLLAVVLTFVIFSIRRHNRHKQQIERLNAVIEGGEQERSRIGRELHDGIMVQFSAVKMNLSTLINRYSHLPGIASFKEPVTQLDNATRELRRTAHNLMPAALLEEGLTDAVYFFCKNLEQSVPLSINVQSFGTIPRFPPETELSIYRIIQELVHNIIKHAHATQALIELSGQNNLLLISIEDNGQGIPENVQNNIHGKIGLTTVRNRISALNGHLDIRSIPGRSTVINIEFDINHLTGEKQLKHAY